jgi:tetratricopeptide (TPR) repeat protein
MHLADLQGQRGKYQEEEQIYDKVLSIDPNNIIAMNNRAWLLALRSGNGSAAQPLIESALAVLGPRPELLDTRAMVHLALHDAPKAIADLEKAVVLDTPTASRYFHLARAYHMGNKPEAAYKAFRKAKELGLDRTKLHPVELAACGKLFDELERR